MKPLVSILIPAYNAEAWLGDTIRSALAQTWPRKEVIVVDDGSKDDTLAVARQFASAEVSVVTQANAGAAAARNNALSRCQGDFIQWLDADDLLAPDKIMRQMETFEKNQDLRVLLSGEWGQFYHRPKKARFCPTALWADLTPADWLVLKLDRNLFMQTATWLTSRELAEAAGPWDGRLLSDDDGEYFCRVLLRSDGVKFISGARVFYRVSGSASLSYVGDSRKKLEALLLSMQLHVAYLRSLEDSERVRQACLAYLKRNLIFFYPEFPELVAQAHALAAAFAAHLPPPTLSWKYVWIQKVFGWSAAKKVQRTYNQVKSSLHKQWDAMLA